MKRFLAIVFLLLFVWSVVALLFHGASAETLYACTVRDDLNGRSRPSTSAPIEMRIPPGDAVEAVSYKDGWVEVVGGESGTVWCKAEYLSSTQDAVYFKNTSGGRVFLRNGIEGAKTGVVKANKVVLVTRQIFGWGYIGNGWVDLSYFEIEQE